MCARLTSSKLSLSVRQRRLSNERVRRRRRRRSDYERTGRERGEKFVQLEEKERERENKEIAERVSTLNSGI